MQQSMQMRASQFASSLPQQAASATTNLDQIYARLHNEVVDSSDVVMLDSSVKPSDTKFGQQFAQLRNHLEQSSAASRVVT